MGLEGNLFQTSDFTDRETEAKSVEEILKLHQAEADLGPEAEPFLLTPVLSGSSSPLLVLQRQQHPV